MAQNQLKEDLILNTGQFDSKIDNVIKKVEELEAKGASAGNGFSSSMGKLINGAKSATSSWSTMASAAVKFSAALGVVKGGLDIADWFSNSVQEGLKLEKEAEGIRIAFERLNNPNLLDGLREATHNTVNDVELMKAAVKFNDFNLPLDQMGTLLAYAQQKAKDTGESIDYMVDSIVTGLGRKSLPILDNLGLSSTEIKAKMKEVGDMTTAVAAIIKERMEASGGYVETAADRAKRKEVELENELIKLGQTFAPLEETAGNFWHSLEMGAIRFINKMAPIINQFTELGRIMNQFNGMGGNNKVNELVANLGEDKGRAKKIYDAQLKEFDKFESKLKFKIAAFNGDKSGIAQSAVQKLKEQLEGVKKLREEFVKEANKKFNTKKIDKPKEEPSANTKTNKNVLIYRAEATTIEQITENIKYLEQEQKKAEPKSQAYKDITKELENWRRKLQLVDFDKTAVSVDGIQKNINILRSQLNRLDPNTKEFKEVNKQLKEEEDKLKKIQSIIDDLGFDENAKTIEGINNNIAILQNKLNALVVGSEEYRKTWEKIRTLQGQRDVLLSDAEVGSIAYYRKELAKINDELEKKNLTSKSRNELVQYKAVLEDLISNMEKANNMSLWTKSQFTGKTRIAIEQFQNFKTSLQDIKDVYEDGLINEEDFRKGLSNIYKLMKDSGFPPFEIEVIPRWKLDFDKDFEKFNINASSIFGGFEGIDNIVTNIESLSNAIEEGANAWEIFMGVLRSGMSIIDAVGSTMDAVATIQSLLTARSTATAVAKQAEGAASVEAAGEEAATIPVKTTAIATNKALEASVLDLAAAQIFLAHAAIPLAGVGIAGSQIATMMAAMAAQHAASLSLAAYANGGIVGGNSYAGDNLVARVNSGEMILTTFQQKKLFDLLDSPNTSSNTLGDVHFVIQGKDLVGTLSNYNKITSKLR